MDKHYTTYGHAKSSLKYHIIFSTKYRRKCLTDIRDIVLESFRKAEYMSDFLILSMELDKDHIHFLLSFKPSLSIEQVVRRMKQISTIYIYERCGSHMRRFYFGEDRHLWTRGYFCSTIGEVSEDTVRYYIENQG